MKMPTSTYKPNAGSSPSKTPMDLPDISLNAEHYDELIKNRGILFTHTHALPCPNIDDVNAAVHDGDCHHDECDNGYLQVMPKQIWGFFNNDQLNKLFEVQGEYNSNVAVITFSAKYVDGTEADLQTFDRVMMVGDYSKRLYEVFESSPLGIDRLRYKATKVEYLIYKSGVVYEQDVHFVLENGRIKWITSHRPQYNQAIGRGEVCSVSYTVPVRYYVNHVMKEIRGTQVLDPMTVEKVAVRLPQHVLVSREFLFPDKDDNEGKNTAKFARKGLRTPG